MNDLLDLSSEHMAQMPMELLQCLFDALPEVVYFVKDREGRYTHANHTLLERLNLHELGQLRGRRVDEMFPAPLGQRFAAQDEAVLNSGQDIRGQVELHLYPDHSHGWCVTHKLAMRGTVANGSKGQGKVRGLVGISRDLEPSHRAVTNAATHGQAYARLALVIERMQQRFAEPLEIRTLATEAGMSIAQLERRFMQLFRLTPIQWLARRRLEAAVELLKGDASVTHIAHACGYADHSAFTRQFRRVTGITPRDWRKLNQP